MKRGPYLSYLCYPNFSNGDNKPKVYGTALQPAGEFFLVFFIPPPSKTLLQASPMGGFLIRIHIRISRLARQGNIDAGLGNAASSVYRQGFSGDGRNAQGPQTFHGISADASADALSAPVTRATLAFQ